MATTTQGVPESVRGRVSDRLGASIPSRARDARGSLGQWRDLFSIGNLVGPGVVAKRRKTRRQERPRPVYQIAWCVVLSQFDVSWR